MTGTSCRKAYLALGFCVLLFGSAEPQHPRDLKFPPLRFDPPKIERRTLSNGLRLFLLEDHDLPIFQMTLWVRGGWADRPTGKARVGYLVDRVMRIGGTKTRAPDTFGSDLGFTWTMETWVGPLCSGIDCKGLSRKMDPVLELFADLLLNPAFDAEKVRQQKQLVLEQIRRTSDFPFGLAMREFNRACLGAGHPLYGFSDPGTVERITRADLVEFHRRYFVAEGAALAAAGDFKPNRFAERLEKLLGGWRGRLPDPTPIPEPNRPRGRSIYLVRKDAAQSQIRLGHLGIKLHNPDSYALRVMNRILGEGAGSRLYQEVRASKGLAYTIGSYLVESPAGGVFGVHARASPQGTTETISVILEAMEEMTQGPPTEEELRTARDGVVNSHIFQFESRYLLVRQILSDHMFGYPDNHVEIYPDRVQAVTAQDVFRVARRYLHPNDVIIVVVGDPDKFGKPLRELGPVKLVEITD